MVYVEMAERGPGSGSGAQERRGLEIGLRVRISLCVRIVLSGNPPTRDRTSANSNGPTGKRASVRLGLSGNRVLVRIRLSVQRCRLCRGVCVGRNNHQSMEGRTGRRADVPRIYTLCRLTRRQGRTCLRCDLVRRRRTGAGMRCGTCGVLGVLTLGCSTYSSGNIEYSGAGVRCGMVRLGVGSLRRMDEGYAQTKAQPSVRR